MSDVISAVRLKPDQFEVVIHGIMHDQRREVVDAVIFGEILIAVSKAFKETQSAFSVERVASEFTLVVKSARTGSAYIIVQAVAIGVGVLAGDAATAVANFFGILAGLEQMGWKSKAGLQFLRDLRLLNHRNENVEGAFEALARTLDRVDRVELTMCTGEKLVLEGAKFRKPV